MDPGSGIVVDKDGRSGERSQQEIAEELRKHVEGKSHTGVSRSVRYEAEKDRILDAAASSAKSRKKAPYSSHLAPPKFTRCEEHGGLNKEFWCPSCNAPYCAECVTTKTLMQVSFCPVCKDACVDLVAEYEARKVRVDQEESRQKKARRGRKVFLLMTLPFVTSVFRWSAGPLDDVFYTLFVLGCLWTGFFKDIDTWSKATAVKIVVGSLVPLMILTVLAANFVDDPAMVTVFATPVKYVGFSIIMVVILWLYDTVIHEFLSKLYR